MGCLGELVTRKNVLKRKYLFIQERKKERKKMEVSTEEDQ